MSTSAILFNSPALHSLKRDQLVKLCKIHSIKANGKNVDLIERLKQHASSLPADAALHLPLPDSDDDPEGLLSPQRAINRPSEQWEVVMEDINEEDPQGTANSKRTVNATEAGEFGTAMSKSTSVGSSFRAFANSLGLKRGMGESPTSLEIPIPSISLPQSSPIGEHPSSEYDAPIPGNPLLPGAPAPSNARLSLTDPVMSTTIRLVKAPVQSSLVEFPTPPRLQPFKTSFDLVMGSPRSSAPKWPASPFKTAGPGKIYPAIPTDDVFEHAHPDYEDIPGGLTAALSDQTLPHASSEPNLDVFSSPAPASTLSPPQENPFLFGSPLPQHRVSNNDFGKAAFSVLDEMNKRLGLEGDQKVGIDILAKRDLPDVSNSRGPTKRDGIRFDKAHQDAFTKMDSIATHYAAKRPRDRTEPDGKIPGTNKRKSEALGVDATRSVKKTFTGAIILKAIPGGFGNEEEEEVEDQRISKRPRVASVTKAENTEVTSAKDGETVRKAREVEAVRRKAEARRRSSRVTQGGINTGLARQSLSRGRVSTVTGKSKVVKAPTSRFGFLSSAKNLVKNVWKGVGPSTPVSGTKLTKPDPTVAGSASSKASIARASRPSISSNASSKPAAIPSSNSRGRFGFGTANNSVAGSSGTPKAGSSSSLGQRQSVANRDRTNSHTGSIDTAASKLRANNDNVQRARTTSTLMAPTASSLAKMQSNRPPPPSSKPPLKKVFNTHNTKAVVETITNNRGTPQTGRMFNEGLTTATFPSPSKIPVVNLTKAVADGVDAKTSVPRRPRISRSRVIAKLGAQRNAGTGIPGSSTRTSAGPGKIRSSLGNGVVRKSYGGVKTRTSNGVDVLMNAKKKARASEYARRKSKASRQSDVEMKDA